MWAGDGLIFHTQLSSEPSKLTAPQLVKKERVCATVYKPSVSF